MIKQFFCHTVWFFSLSECIKGNHFIKILMHPEECFDDWIAMSEEVLADMDQLSIFLPDIRRLLNEIVQTGFLPDPISSKTTIFLKKICQVYPGKLLIQPRMTINQITTYLEIAKLLLHFSLYGIEIGDASIFLMGARFLENDKVLTYTNNPEYQIMKTLANFYIEDLDVIDTIFRVSRNNIQTFSILSKYLYIICVVCLHKPDVSYDTIVDIFFNPMQSIINSVHTTPYPNDISLIFNYLSKLIKSNDDSDKFSNSFLTILPHFIFSDNFEQRYHGLTAIKEIATKPHTDIHIARIFSTAANLESLSQIPFDKKISENLGILYGCIARNDSFTPEIIEKLWEKHKTMHKADIEPFFDMLLKIASCASSETLTQIICYILSDPEGIPCYYDLLEKLVLNIGPRQDSSGFLASIKNTLSGTAFDTSNEFCSKAQKVLKTIVKFDSSSFMDLATDLIEGNIPTDCVKFVYQLLKEMLAQKSTVEGALLERLLTFTIDGFFGHEEFGGMAYIVPSICEKMQQALSNEHMERIISHSSSPRFYEFLQYITSRNVISNSGVSKLVWSLGRNPNKQFYKIFRSICTSVNRLDIPYTSLPLQYEEYMWKFALAEGPCRDDFQKLLCELICNNDGEFITDMTMINYFLDKIEMKHDELVPFAQLLGHFVHEIEDIADPIYMNNKIVYYESRDGTVIDVNVTLPNEQRRLYHVPKSMTAGSLLIRLERDNLCKANTSAVVANKHQSLLPRNRLLNYSTNSGNKFIANVEIKTVDFPTNGRKMHIRKAFPSLEIKNRHLDNLLNVGLKLGYPEAYNCLRFIGMLESTKASLRDLLEPESTPDNLHMVLNDQVSCEFAYTVGVAQFVFREKNQNHLLEIGFYSEAFSILRDFIVTSGVDEIINDAFNTLMFMMAESKLQFGFDEAKKIYYSIAEILKYYAKDKSKTVYIAGYYINCKFSLLHKFLFIPDMVPLLSDLLLSKADTVPDGTSLFLNSCKIPTKEFLNVLENKTVNKQFLECMTKHFNDFPPIPEEREELAMTIVQKMENLKGALLIEYINSVKWLVDLKQAGYDVETTLLYKLADRFLRFDIDIRDRVAFNAAAELFVSLSHVEKDNQIILLEIIQKLHSSATQLLEFEINGDECMQVLPRPGIKKNGMTCYLNSVIQQLYSIPQLRNAIISYRGTDNSIVQLTKLFTHMSNTNAKAVPAAPFIAAWTAPGFPVIDTREQQDASEFMVSVLDKLNMAPGINETIHSLVEGKIKHTVKGINVEYESSSEEEFTVFSLELASSLIESFKNFTNPDYYVGDNQYSAEGVGKIDAARSHSIGTPPPVLFIQLKRFDYDFNENIRKKLAQYCEIPFEMDISPFVGAETPVYRLRSFIVHKGTATAGHYITYAFDNGTWMCFDDNNVSIAKLSVVKTMASGGVNVDGCGFVFAYAQDGIEDIDAIPDAQQIDEIERENEMIAQESLFCSSGYNSMMFALASFTPYTYVCLKYFSDIAPHSVFANSTVTVLFPALAKNHELGLFYFSNVYEKLYSALVRTPALNIRQMHSTYLIQAVMSGGITSLDVMKALAPLFDYLLYSYDYINEYFKVINGLMDFDEAAIDALKESGLYYMLPQFLFTHLDKYISQITGLLRNYIVSTLNLSYYLIVLSKLKYPMDDFPMLYKDQFLVDICSGKSDSKGISSFVHAYVGNEGFLRFFSANPHLIKEKIATSVLFSVAPESATELLIKTSKNLEDTGTTLSEIAITSRRAAKAILNASDIWIPVLLFNENDDTRKAGGALAAAIAPSEEYVKYVELDGEIQTIPKDAVENSNVLLEYLVKQVDQLIMLMHEEMMNNNCPSDNGRPDEYIQAVKYLLMVVTRVPSNLPSIAKLFAAIGDTCDPFDEQGTQLLFTFNMFSIPLDPGLVYKLLDGKVIKTKANGDLVAKLLPQLGMFVTNNPSEAIVNWVCSEVIFKISSFVKLKDGINAIASMCRSINVFQKYVDEHPTSIETNYYAALYICYVSGSTKNFMTNISQHLPLIDCAGPSDVIKMAVQCNDGTQISRIDYDAIMDSEDITEEAKVILQSYVESLGTPIIGAPSGLTDFQDDPGSEFSNLIPSNHEII